MVLPAPTVTATPELISILGVTLTIIEVLTPPWLCQAAYPP